MKRTWEQRRRRVCEIIEIGNDSDFISRGYDFLNTLCIIINLIVSVMYTFEGIRSRYGSILLTIEGITVLSFAVDYFLRIWTAKYTRQDMGEIKAILKYMFSFTGVVDILSFLPYYLPVFFPSGAVAFRMFRVIRIFRLFRINAYYDSLNVITEVIVGKSQQLLSSVFIILVLMLASSLCMYSLEHSAQPDVFTNAFSGIWWSVSTLLTIGYGDIYPITTMGKAFSIIITFLGVGMVAIPTGIISAGFVDQYTRVKRMSDYGNEEDIRFIKIHITKSDKWADQMIRDLGLPYGVIVAAIRRNHKIIIPKGDVVLRPDDVIVLGAESFHDNEHINLKEVVLKKQNPWIGQYIRDLDISRLTIIVMVKRKDTVLIPKGDLLLLEGDTVILYTQKHLAHADTIAI
ncbi:MAG: ion transporter [Eubacteriales bacterium]|nr:ion transporter [Eubacteriales bacterium]